MLQNTQKLQGLFSNNHLFNGLLGDIYSDTGNFEKAKYNYKKQFLSRLMMMKPFIATQIPNWNWKKKGIDYLNQALKVNPQHAISYYSLSQ